MGWQEGNIARMQSIRDLLSLRGQSMQHGIGNLQGLVGQFSGMAEAEKERQFQASEAEKARQGRLGEMEKGMELEKPYTPTWEEKSAEAQKDRDARWAEITADIKSREKIAGMNLRDLSPEDLSNIQNTIDKWFTFKETHAPNDIITPEGILDWSRASKDPTLRSKYRAEFQSWIAQMNPAEQAAAMELWDNMMDSIGSGVPISSPTTQAKPTAADVNAIAKNIQTKYGIPRETAGKMPEYKRSALQSGGADETALEKSIDNLIASTPNMSPEDKTDLEVARDKSDNPGFLSYEEWVAFTNMVQKLTQKYQASNPTSAIPGGALRNLR